jgi:hypothetical protein
LFQLNLKDPLVSGRAYDKEKHILLAQSLYLSICRCIKKATTTNKKNVAINI